MEEQQSLDTFLPPVHTNTFGIPDKANIMVAYDIYKPSRETRKLLSERGRTIFSEVYIEDPNLGTLADLAVGALAQGLGPKDIPSMVQSDPLKLRIYYDSLSVDLPLEVCYGVTDQLFWRRVVLAKHKDRALALKKSYNWKSLGITLKFVELVESCPAEYWPEEEMHSLADKIRPYVTEMQISKLRPLQDRAFEEYFQSDSSVISEGSEESWEPSSSTSSLQVEEGEEENEYEEENEEDEDWREYMSERAARRAERAIRKQALSDAREARRLSREERRRIREAKLAPPPEPPEPIKKKKKKGITGVLDISVSEDEDEDADKDDKRNLEKYLEKKKKYKYPPEHCHHIDLSFVGEFIYLTKFTIEFHPPDQQLNYHPRFFNFSYLDVQRLAESVSRLLLLKTFRLINSRMDARKLEILLKPLRTLPEIEELDFSNDQLQDDCGISIFEFFRHNTSLKRFEFKNNPIGHTVLERLASGLRVFGGRLKYLGLGGNWFTDMALDKLVSVMVDKAQVEHLCLRGAHISQLGLSCCIANKLIRHHKPLLELDLIAVKIDETARVELITALQTNKVMLRLACKGTGLPIDIQTDIMVILERNQYLIDNPYIGDETKTEEEINTWLERVKDPILLEAMERVRKRVDCMTVRPLEFRRSTLDVQEVEEENMAQVESDIWSLDKLIPKPKEEDDDSEEESKEPSVKVEELPPFVFDPNTFTLEQFLQHVTTPGPTERYFYFQNQPDIFNEQAPEQDLVN